MAEILNFKNAEIIPDRKVILRGQGIPPDVEPTSRITDLLEEAFGLFEELSRPRGIRTGISVEDFKDVYNGEGHNEESTPLELIYPRAQSLELYALTLGGEISAKIAELFGANDMALGYTLDAIASEAADRASELAAELYRLTLVKKDPAAAGLAVLPYSPGYCGWHVSGQKKLFEYLEPGKIGISLNSSFLMVPLKSVSGVLVAGQAAIHRFRNDYPFCALCSDKQCRLRMARIAEKNQEWI